VLLLARVAMICEPNAIASVFSNATASVNPRLAPLAQAMRLFSMVAGFVAIR
jgi:hypothetical protein